MNELKGGNVGWIPRGHDLSAYHTPCGVALTVRTPRIRQCIKRSATRAKEAAAFWDRPDKRHGGLPQLFGTRYTFRSATANQLNDDCGCAQPRRAQVPCTGHSTKDAIALRIQKPKNAVHAALSPNPQISPVIRNTEDMTLTHRRGQQQLRFHFSVPHTTAAARR
jgi:hypothetical protein